MKKLLVVLLLAVLLTATFVTPAFADDGKGNMPGKAADLGWWLGLQNAFKRLGWGCIMSDGNAVYGAIGGFYAIYYNVINGQPPAKPSWAQGPK